MIRFLKIAVLSSIALVLLLAALLFTFYRLIEVGEFRHFLIGEVERQTHLKLKVGEGRLHLGTVMGIAFHDVALLEPENQQLLMEVETVVVRVALLQLLQRRLVFDEIRLQRPRIQITRDPSGRVPLLERVLGLVFQELGDVRFELNLHEVKTERGEVLFTDSRKEGPIATRLIDLNMNLRRSGRKEPYLPAADGSKETSTESRSALSYDLKTTVERNGRKAGLIASGSLTLPNGEFELARAGLDADIRVEKLPADLFHDYYGHLLPVKKIQGWLNGRFVWQGSLAPEGLVKADIAFKQLEVDATDVFRNPLALGDGTLDLQAEWSSGGVRLQRLDLRSRELTVAARGTVRSAEGRDSNLSLRVSTPFLSVVSARKYIPVKVLPPWERVVSALNQGEVRLAQAEVSATLSELGRPFDHELAGRMRLDVEVKGLGGNPGEPYLTLREVSGRIILENGVLHYKGFRGAYGLSELAQLEGTQSGVFAGPSLLEIQARGEADLTELRGQLKLDFLPSPMNKIVADADELAGRAKFTFSLRKNAASYEYTGQSYLENARLRVGDISLAQITGGLSLSPKEVRSEKLTALLAGSPIQASGALREYQSEKPALDLTVESPGVKAGFLTRLILSNGSLEDPGMVRGTVRYQGLLNSARDHKLSGSLDLVGIQVPVRFLSEPLSDVSGNVKFDGNGAEFDGFKAQLAGFGFNFSGQWRHGESPEVVFTLNVPEVDLGRVLSRQNMAHEEWQERLRARGKVTIGRGRFEGFEFSDLKTDLTFHKREWRLENVSARSEGGTVEGAISFIDRHEEFGILAKPHIQGVPAQAVLKWFDVEAQEMTGDVYASGSFESSGATRVDRRKNLNGDFNLEIKNGVIRRMRLLVNILNVLDLTRWFTFQVPDFTQKGVSFRSVTGNFNVHNGVFRTENLVVDSDDISITGAGQYDRPNDSIDAVVALRPFPRVRTVVNYIPLIGPGIAAIKDSVMVASFHVRGPMENPKVTPAPLSTLSEFFFGALKIPQKLITIPGAEKK